VLPFEPQQAFFVAEYPDGSVVRIPAIALAPFQSSVGIKEGASWQVGAWYTPQPGIERLRVALIIVGTSDRYFSLPFREFQISEIRARAATLDDLRNLLLRRKDVLHSWEVQIGEQERMLNRLRADAEVIGGVSRIIDAKEEKQRIDLEIASIDKNIKSLDKLVQVARSRPAPRNLARREQQLSSQVTLLAAAAKDAENGENSRRGVAEQSLQQKLALVEQTRDDDIDLLKRELQSLQAELGARRSR
jgi:hypothetical protein